MSKCIVVKGGWSWKGVVRNAGDVIEGVTDEWITNRIADGGLVEAIAEVEHAVVVAPERAVAHRKGKNK